MRISYIRNAGVKLDADLALLVVGADILVRTQSYSDPPLKCSAEFLRPALEIGCGVAQTRV